MIQISTFNLMIVMGMVLLLYSFVDHRNRLYANIPAAVSSGILFSFAGAAIAYGGVSTGASPSTGSILGFLSVIAFSYTMFMVYEVIDEQFQMKAENERVAQEGEKP
jgi:cell division protein FtsW (lipid II flippase)